MKSSKVCIIGLGYIGLPTASVLASEGFSVNGFDVDQDVLDAINEGKVHIIEPGLETHVEKSIRTGNLKAYSEPKESEIYLICVPTPFSTSKTNTPTPDISFIEAAVKRIFKLLKPNDLIILEVYFSSRHYTTYLANA